MTLWRSADATAAWRPSPSGRLGAPKPFSDCAIETALTLRRVVRWPLRHAAGGLRSVLSVMGVDLDAPDHPTRSRRSQSLAVACRRLPSSGPLHLLVDSTGLSMVGEGAWAAVNHGGRGPRGGKKRPLAGDRAGVIVAPPAKTARGSRRRPRSRARDRTITDVRTARPAPLEAGGRLPSPGAGGACVLSVPIDDRGPAARPVPRRASGRVRGRGSRPATRGPNSVGQSRTVLVGDLPLGWDR